MCVLRKCKIAELGHHRNENAMRNGNTYHLVRLLNEIYSFWKITCLFIPIINLKLRDVFEYRTKIYNLSISFLLFRLCRKSQGCSKHFKLFVLWYPKYVNSNTFLNKISDFYSVSVWNIKSIWNEFYLIRL